MIKDKMPTYTNSKIPPPKSWDEFEDVVTDIAKLKWKNPNVTRYGRTGQRQNGIDIIGEPFYLLNEYSGVQCKNLENDLTLTAVEQGIKEAELFKPKIKEFIIACINHRDSKMQSSIMEISQERKKSNKFSVLVWFWDDLFLELSGNAELMEKYYPQYINKTTTYEKVIKIIAESDISDWKYDDEEGIYTYKPDVNLTIRRFDTDLRDDYSEPWLNKYPDKRGFRMVFNIFYSSSFIKKEYVVGVDGFRGYVPFPLDGYSTNPKLTPWQYKIGKIIHSKAGFPPPIYSFDRILERANISVTDE